MTSSRGALLAVMVMALSALGGCGEERSFGAEEFVEEVNAQGVELRLGGELSTTEAGAELYGVELEPLVGAPPVPGQEPGHTGGSLAVYDDSSAAEERFQTCDQAVDLLCYQAANVVVILESSGIEAQRLGVAIEKLADE